MIRLAAIILAFVSTAAFAVAAPRFALVRVTDIYKDLPATKQLQEEVQAKRDAVLRDERADALRKILEELQSLQTEIRNNKTELDAEGSRKVARNYEMKRREAQTLQEEFENYRAEKTKEINREMVVAMRASLDQIVAISRKLAKEQGYDGIFDSSGSSNTGVPLILYSKNTKDLTKDVIAALQDASAAPPVNKANR